MKKSSILFLIVLATSAFGQKSEKESISFEKPPVIDGHVEDWPGEWWLDPDGKFFCNVGNDENNLYIRLKVADDLTQQKIGLFGLYLKLNPSGKRKGKVGLKYPVGKDESEFKKNEPTAVDRASDIESMAQLKKELVSDVEVVELIGLAKQSIVSSRLGLTNGIEALILAQEDGAYIYEAKIPFKAFRINKKEVTIMGVEFQTGRYTPKNNTNMAQNQSMSPSYGNSPGGYGPGYGGARQPRAYFNNVPYNALSSVGYYFVGVKLK